MSEYVNIFGLGDEEREAICGRLFGGHVGFYTPTPAEDLFKEMEDFSHIFQFENESGVKYAIRFFQRYGRQWIEGDIREDRTVTKIPMMRAHMRFTDEDNFIPQLRPECSPYLDEAVITDLNHYLIEMATYPKIRIGSTRTFFDNVIGRLKYLRERDLARIESLNANLFRSLFSQEVSLSLSADGYHRPKVLVVDIVFKDVNTDPQLSYVVKRNDNSAKVVKEDIERRLKELTKDNPPEDFRGHYQVLREVLNCYDKSQNTIRVNADWSY